MTFLLQLYPGDQIARIVAMVIGQVALLVVVAFVLSRFLARRRAVTRSAVWLATLVCVLFAPLLAGGLEFAEVTLVRLPMSVSTVVEAEIPRPTPMPPAFSETDMTTGVPLDDAEESSDVPVAKVTSRSFSRTEKWRAAGSCLMLLWLIGVLVCAFRFLYGCLVLTRLRRDLREVDDTAIPVILADVCQKLGMRRIPKLVTSQRLSGPVATSGPGGPMVILSQRLLDELNHRQLRDVLTHECAHLKQRDILIGVLLRITLVIYWPHLMVRVLNRELHAAREEICDNHVLQQGDAAGYARTIVQISTDVLVTRIPVATCGMLNPVLRLETRVAALLNERRDLMTKTNWSSFVLFGLLFLAMSVLTFGTRQVSAQNNDAHRSEAERKAIEAASYENPVINKTGGHQGAVNSVAVSPDGKQIATGGAAATGKGLPTAKPARAGNGSGNLFGGTKSAARKRLPPLKWGKSWKGLVAAHEVLAKGDEIQVGQKVTVRFYVRNTGKSTVSFQYGVKNYASLSVADKDDKPRKVNGVDKFGHELVQKVVLRPGEEWDFGRGFTFVVVSSRKEAFKLFADAYPICQPGKHSFKFTLQLRLGKEHQPVASAATSLLVRKKEK